MNMKINLDNTAGQELNFAEALGINPTREKEIRESIQKHYLACEGNDLDAIMHISGEVHNPNELTYAMLFYGICVGGAHTEEELWNKLVA